MLSSPTWQIAYVCNPASVSSQSERVSGYRAAMTQAGIDNTSRWERLLDDRNRLPDEIVGELLDMPDAPTAIICGNNQMTIGALRALRRRSDDATAIIGFDDFDTADVIGVTVITYDAFELGRITARLTVERIMDPTGAPRQLSLPTWIVERGTGERPPSRSGGSSDDRKLP